MNKIVARWYCLLPTVLLLTGCDVQSGNMLVSLLVLVPLVLLMGVFWWLNLYTTGKENWEEKHFPDQEDDDEEDHFLM